MMVTYTRPDGATLEGFLATPTAAAAPGIVVIQEWWGLNDQIEHVAERFARLGYRALVPDLFRGQRAYQEHEAQHLMGGLDFADAASQDIRGAVQHLKAAGCDRVAVTGFCMGGALTVLALMHVPEADAGIVWYGCPPLEYVDATRIRVPLQGHWAKQDSVFPMQLADGLERKLREARASYEFYRYEARHAFANEEADRTGLDYLRYDAEAAALAWERTEGFLRVHVPVPRTA
ncbi:MAG TPA: dienelactone hydrolase family protein [Steroidobacteraceae bacterium]|nr:dienelactone hydrolase family protein [Steroidobacteraceae bacterium]